jgi:hypothetical protein
MARPTETTVVDQLLAGFAWLVRSRPEIVDDLPESVRPTDGLTEAGDRGRIGLEITYPTGERFSVSVVPLAPSERPS